MHTEAESDVDYGPPAVMRVCLLKTDDVPAPRAEQLIAAVNDEFARYGIRVKVPWVRSWQRPGFDVNAIITDVARRDLESPCDRLVALVDRNFGDFAWGLLMPEVLGAVEDVTATRGYVVATSGSINQLLMPPGMTTVHEFYHLLGCPHGLTLTKCYPKIAALKRAIDPAADFFPGVARYDAFLTTREAANTALSAFLAEEERKAAAKRTRGVAIQTSPAATPEPMTSGSH